MSPSSVLSLPELSEIIVRAPNLGLPSPLFSRDPQFVLELLQDSLESRPWLLPMGTIPASSM